MNKESARVLMELFSKHVTMGDCTEEEFRALEVLRSIIGESQVSDSDMFVVITPTGEKIKGIKLIRDLTSMGLKEAKDCMEMKQPFIIDYNHVARKIQENNPLYMRIFDDTSGHVLLRKSSTGEILYPADVLKDFVKKHLEYFI